MKYLHLIIIALILLSSCSEDPVATNNGNNNGTPAVKPALVLKPDTLYGKTLTVCCFEARVDGFIHNDIDLYWYFGEGDTVYQDKYNHGYACHLYKNPGTYTIFVKAVDAFADTVIDTKTTIAVISDVEKKVTISPSSSDIILGSDITGQYYQLSFQFTTTLPTSRVRAVWHISDGSNDTTTYGDNGLSRFVRQSGYYTARVSIYDTNNVLWASDTTTIHIIPMEVTADRISKMNMVSVTFKSLDPIFNDPYNSGANFWGSVLRGDSYTNTFSLKASGINCTYSKPYTEYGNNRVRGVEFTGAFSSDLRKIENLSMYMYDTLLVDDTTRYESSILLPLKNLRLISVSNNFIVYGAYGVPLPDFLGNVVASIYKAVMSTVGEYYNSYGTLYNAYGKDSPPYAFVILSAYPN